MTTNNKITIKKKQIGACPECDANIHFSKILLLGLRKECPECRAELDVVSLSPIELEVISLSPLELDWPAEEYSSKDHYKRNYYDYQ